MAASLVGEPVLWVVSDPVSGAMIEFGARQRLARPIPNPALPTEQREFEGEKSLFIRCSWELILQNASPDVAGSGKGAESLELLDRLAGMTVTRAEIDEISCNLTLEFDHVVHLRVNPTKAPSRLEGGYTVRIERSYWSVSNRGEVSEENG